MLLTKNKKKSRALSKPELLLVFGSFLLISLPSLFYAMGIIQILISLFLGIKIMSIIFQINITKWFLLMALLVIIVFVGFHRELLMNRDIVFIFILLSSLKLVELKQLRDAYFIFLVNGLLSLSSLMFTSSILGFIFILMSFLFNFYVYLRVTHPLINTYQRKVYYQLLTKLILISTPIVLILFFIFPRIDPLWKTASTHSATGLSEQMTPNSLSQLVQDGGIAFRVKFNKSPPPNNLLYWRGPVLNQFDGKTWSRGPKKTKYFDLNGYKTNNISYKMYHNGGTNKWLVPLDLPINYATEILVLSKEAELYSKNNNLSGAYNIVSNPYARISNLTSLDKLENIDLPKQIFPKTRLLANKIYQNSRNSEDFIQNLLNYFSSNNFYYDFDPPVGNSNLDNFLFENKVGYCEHYASVFAFMLRSQNIPARIVTGYQGGELNPISNEMEVKQLNAHAWVEVYITEKGWVRFDPTAAVAPYRISQGSPLGVARNDNQIAIFERLEKLSGNYKSVMNFIRATNAFWQNWVIDYNSNKQNKLFNFDSLNSQLMTVMATLLALLIILIIRYKRLIKIQELYKDDLSESMHCFINYLSNHQIPVLLTKPLIPQIELYQTSLGNIYQEILSIVRLYYQIRYQSDNSDKMKALLIYKIKNLLKNKSLKKDKSL